MAQEFVYRTFTHARAITNLNYIWVRIRVLFQFFSDGVLILEGDGGGVIHGGLYTLKMIV